MFFSIGKVKTGTSKDSSAGSATQNYDQLTAAEMYTEASEYAKLRFNEFNEKKIAFNEALRLKTLREQKELGAKYAAILAARADPSGEDFYYWGLLHWLAENADGAGKS